MLMQVQTRICVQAQLPLRSAMLHPVMVLFYGPHQVMAHSVTHRKRIPFILSVHPIQVR